MPPPAGPGYGRLVTARVLGAPPPDERFRELVGDVRFALLWGVVVASAVQVDGRPILAPIAAVLLLRAARALERADLPRQATARARGGRVAATVGLVLALGAWVPGVPVAAVVVAVGIATGIVLFALAECLLAEADDQGWSRSARRWRAAARWSAGAAASWVALAVVAATGDVSVDGPGLHVAGWAAGVVVTAAVVTHLRALLLWAGVPMGWWRRATAGEPAGAAEVSPARPR